MKCIRFFATVLALSAAPVLVMAQSAFDGTWKVDLQSVEGSGTPHAVVLKDGVYWCKSCKPAYHIRADGAFHAVSGHSDIDMEAVHVVDDHTVRFTDKKDGKVVSISTIAVAPDDRTATYSFEDRRNGHDVNGELTAVRVAAAPAGANAISGSWQLQHYNTMSQNALTVTFRTEGDVLHFDSMDGTSYSATLGGKAVPVKGGDDGETVSVARVEPNVLRETYHDDKGRVETMITSTLAPDGRTMHVVSDNPRMGRKTTWTLVRQ